MGKKLPPHQDSKIISAKLNPLADYKAQVAPNRITKSMKISQTSMSNDPRMDLIRKSEGSDFTYRPDMGNFDHSKVLTSIDSRNRIMSLNSNSQKLFLWVVFALSYRSDTVKLDFDKMKELGFKMANATFRNSIDDLISKEIIQRVDPKVKSDDYWQFFINPQVIFKGDAKQFYKDVLLVHPEYESI